MAVDLQAVARVVPVSASVRLEWAGVAEAHNAKPGDLCSLEAARTRIADLERERDSYRSDRGSAWAEVSAKDRRIADLEAALAQAEADKGRLDALEDSEVLDVLDFHAGTATWDFYVPAGPCSINDTARGAIDKAIAYVAARGEDQPTDTEGGAA